jgi:hypothetical protein
VTTDLKDVTDINNRLRQAKGQAAALGTFFCSTADTWSKRLIFLAIPMNTALYGAESWTLNECRTPPTNIFLLPHHHSLNHRNQHAPCCGISQIKNEHIHNYFSVPDPIDIIQKCQFNLLGKFARMDPTHLPRKVLTTWVSHP